MAGEKRQKLYLVDGSSYIFRAYYAIQPLSTSTGQPTNAIYGFIRMIQKLVSEQRPDMLAVIFDRKEPTFRDEMYKEYKANRKEPPDDLVSQFSFFEPIVDALGIHNLSMAGFEADDLIGTIAEKARTDGYDVVVVTGDKDLMQLVGDRVVLYDTMKERWIGPEEVKERFGVPPDRVVDVMSLMGDSSDNIPGVAGIGPKSAAALIRQFGGLDRLLGHIDDVSNVRAKNALKDGVENARLSRELVTIRRDVPMTIDWSDFGIRTPDSEKIRRLFSELEFFKLIREIVPEANEAATTVSIVSKAKELRTIAAAIRSAGEAAVYYLHPIGLGFAWNGGSAYVPVAHETLEEVANVDADDLKDFVSRLDGLKKIFYDRKSAEKALKGRGIAFNGEADDIELMAYVLNPSYPDNLPTLAQQVLGEILDADSGKRTGPATVKAAAGQAVRCAAAMVSLYQRFVRDLAGLHRLHEIYRGMEMPLSSILLEMEEKGIAVDVDQLDELSTEYAGKIEALEKRIYDLAGERFAITSPRQLSHVLFERLGLPAAKKTKTGYSTDASVLADLAVQYELPRRILEYRSLAKLTTTYIDVLPTLVSPVDGRIHTTFNQAVTATGRLSSSDPNLQNIPARTDDGRRIRQAFVAAKGMELVSADYSQIELRILAHISGDQALISAFQKGIDIHRVTASRIFNVAEADVDASMRGMAKTVNFGVLYGQGAFGLSRQLGIDIGAADAYIRNYYEGYPRVRELKEEILEGARAAGYVETLYGRRRYVPDVRSPNPQARAFAERTAFNAVFQGTAADIIKMAMIAIDRRLRESFPKVAMLLQVHDELIFESPSSDVEALIGMVRREMGGVLGLRVPLVVDFGHGKTWADC